jgi:hypothetical protein
MKNILLAALLGMSLVSCRTVDLDETLGPPHISIQRGNRDFDDGNSWGGLDHQRPLGFEATSIGESQWGPEFGASFGDDNRSTLIGTIEADVSELYIGVRREFEPSPEMRFFISGGYSYFSVVGNAGLTRAPDIKFEDRDTAFTPYFQFGGYLFLTDTITAGAQYRWNPFEKDVQVFSVEPELDGGVFLLTLGWHF